LEELGVIKKWREIQKEDYLCDLKSAEELVEAAKTSRKEFKRKSKIANGVAAGLQPILNIPADTFCEVHSCNKKTLLT
jgi:hypothetical protein